MMKNKMSILLVDDEPDLVQTLLDVLKLKGYEVEAAYSGLEALDKVKRKSFDCVMADIKMPKMDGIKLCRAIKEIQPELPVVFLTGCGTLDMITKAEKAGAITTLIKPFDIKALLNVLAGLRKT